MSSAREMHDEIQALRRALEDGELEHDLMIEVVDRNLGELDDAGSSSRSGR